MEWTKLKQQSNGNTDLRITFAVPGLLWIQGCYWLVSKLAKTKPATVYLALVTAAKTVSANGDLKNCHFSQFLVTRVM